MHARSSAWLHTYNYCAKSKSPGQLTIPRGVADNGNVGEGGDDKLLQDGEVEVFDPGDEELQVLHPQSRVSCH